MQEFKPGDEIIGSTARGQELWCTVEDDGTYYVKNGDWHLTPLPDGKIRMHVPAYLRSKDDTDESFIREGYTWELDEQATQINRKLEEGRQKIIAIREEADKAIAELQKQYGIRGDYIFDDDIAF